MTLQHADTPGGTGTPRQDPWQSHEHRSLPRAQLHGSRHSSSTLPSSPPFPTGLGAEAAPCVPPCSPAPLEAGPGPSPCPGRLQAGLLPPPGGIGRAGPGWASPLPAPFSLRSLRASSQFLAEASGLLSWSEFTHF